MKNVEPWKDEIFPNEFPLVAQKVKDLYRKVKPVGILAVEKITN